MIRRVRERESARAASGPRSGHMCVITQVITERVIAGHAPPVPKQHLDFTPRPHLLPARRQDVAGRRWSQLLHAPQQPVRAAAVASRALVAGLQPRAGGGRGGEPGGHLDHPVAPQDEDRHQLLSAQLGFLRRGHGRVQHARQLGLRGARTVVLRRGVLPLPQLLPSGGGVRQHLLHDRRGHRQVPREEELARFLGTRLAIQLRGVKVINWPRGFSFLRST